MLFPLHPSVLPQWISVDALVEDEFKKPLLGLKWLAALVYLREGILRWLEWVNKLIIKEGVVKQTKWNFFL